MSGTLVLLHGAFCGGWCFADFAGHFVAHGWRCLAPDLRHHAPAAGGGAPAALATTGLADYCGDLAALCASLPEPPVIVGHSLGGLLAQQLAARGLARALILLAPAAPWGVFLSSHDEIANALGLLKAGAFWHKVLHPDFETAVATSLDKLDPLRQRRTFERLVPESGRAMFETVYWMFDYRQASAVDHHRVTCPVLCLVGSDDRVVAPATVRSVARRYRRVASYAELPGMSHFLFGEAGEERLIAACADFLDRLPPPGVDPQQGAAGR